METYGSGDNHLIDIYQRYISPVKGGNTCPMHPSCSQYAKMAFHVLPWHKAIPVSFARVLRCGRALEYYPYIMKNGEFKWYDPVVVQNKASPNE